MEKTVFVLVSDETYFPRVKRTILDLRTKGKWEGDIILITIDFTLSRNVADFYNVIEKKFESISEKQELQKQLHYSCFSDTIDGREINKLNQWEKLHVFDDYFKEWNRVVFLDAGLRVLDNVHDSVLTLDYKNAFLAPDDGGNYVSLPNKNKLFKTQLSHSFQKRLLDTVHDFGGEEILEQSYFLNCMWVYDTSILSICSKQEMINGILKYPICLTNEMAMMNFFLTFKYKLWKPFPVNVKNKILFDWCELNNPNPSNWRHYCFIKYPVTISMDD